MLTTFFPSIFVDNECAHYRLQYQPQRHQEKGHRRLREAESTIRRNKVVTTKRRRPTEGYTAMHMGQIDSSIGG